MTSKTSKHVLSVGWFYTSMRILWHCLLQVGNGDMINIGLTLLAVWFSMTTVLFSVYLFIIVYTRCHWARRASTLMTFSSWMQAPRSGSSTVTRLVRMKKLGWVYFGHTKFLYIIRCWGIIEWFIFLVPFFFLCETKIYEWIIVGSYVFIGKTCYGVKLIQL